MAGPTPVTPSKRVDRSQVEGAIASFNHYGLHITLLPSEHTPSQRKEIARRGDQRGRWEEIERRLDFLYRQNALESACKTVRVKIEARIRDWRPQPEKHEILTSSQQKDLEVVIRDVLKQMSDSYKLAKPSLARSKSDNPQTRTKRPSNEHKSDDQEGMRKKLRGIHGHDSSEISVDLDCVPARRRSVSHHRPEPHPHVQPRYDLRRQPSRKSLAAAAESKSSISTCRDSRDSFAPSVFTHRDEDERDSSQTTVPFTSQDSVEYPKLPSPEEYPISSSALNVLKESFSRIEEPISATDAPQGYHSSPARYSTSTVYSTFSFPTDAGLPDGPGGNLDTDSSLTDTWPAFPLWLQRLDFTIAWEVTRACLHCGVDLEHPSLGNFRPTWGGPDLTPAQLWAKLGQLDVFRGKSLPELSSRQAFRAARQSASRKDPCQDMEVTFSAELLLTGNHRSRSCDPGPLFQLQMKPLKLEHGCRLTRRFGFTRYVQLLMPYIDGRVAGEAVDNFQDQVLDWLVNPQHRHPLVGRHWAAFYTKDGRGTCRGWKRVPEAKSIGARHVVYLFAERGVDIPLQSELTLDKMLAWLLHPKENLDQPALKLFSRISLGLSPSTPTIVFEPDQIRCVQDDIRSRIGKVMNDGIGLMSRRAAKLVADILGLAGLPSAVQGRLGPAKGVWLLDVEDLGKEVWIQTYPSQRKWEGDFSGPHDGDQRTLEVLMVASELKTARLNLQFLPILEDRAIEPAVLRKALKKRFQDNLDQNLEGQKMAMDSPVQFLDWIYANEPVRWNRVRTGVNYLAGLPEDKTEILILLLNSGFDLKSQKFVRDEAFNLQKSKCEQLKTKFGVRIPCSAHVLMVVDFWGVLEEDEVHLGFSSKFQTDDAEFEDTMLHGIDVLVGRSPAHFASDIQRVKAVFKPELRTLKDCIVFSRKGDVPLADKLSGGDYDGDKAWVCWDPALVSNFDNAEVPDLARFDLVVSKYTKKDKTKYRELGNGTFHELIRKGFQFNMKHSILGAATEFKEAYLYHSLQTASSEAANLLSTLLGNLVDQSKQGIMFTWGDWLRFQKDLLGKHPIPGQREVCLTLEKPAYKLADWPFVDPTKRPTVLADYLKFEVGLPKIEEFLKNVYQSLESDVQGCRDADLEEYFKDFEVKARNSRPCARVLDKLRKDIDAVRKDWTRATAGGNDKKAKGTEWRAKVGPVYQKWCSIVPSVEMTPGKMRPATMLTQDFLPGDLHSQWALLRASTAYKYHKSNFVWHMAGRHLAEIKARMVSARAGGAPVLLVPELYAAATVDKKYVRLWAATRHEGKSLPDSGGPGGEDGEDYDDDDDDDDDDDELFGDEDTIVYHDEDGYAGP